MKNLQNSFAESCRKKKHATTSASRILCPHRGPWCTLADKPRGPGRIRPGHWLSAARFARWADECVRPHVCHWFLRAVAYYLLCSCASWAQNTSPSYLGFDRNEYPGDASLKTLRQTFSYA